MENRYQKIRKKMEQDFQQGPPKKLKEDLTYLEKKVDKISLQIFDLNPDSPQEVKRLAQQTLNQLEEIIRILPKASELALRMRTQYVVPFTTINSIKAEYQDCLGGLDIEEDQNQKTKNSVYRQLTSEFKELNQELYDLETKNISLFVGYRSQLLLDLEKYNENKNPMSSPSQRVPEILNSVQREIGKILSNLQLSKFYYSVFQ